MENWVRKLLHQLPIDILRCLWRIAHFLKLNKYLEYYWFPPIQSPIISIHKYHHHHFPKDSISTSLSPTSWISSLFTTSTPIIRVNPITRSTPSKNTIKYWLKMKYCLPTALTSSTSPLKPIFLEFLSKVMTYLRNKLSPRRTYSGLVYILYTWT